MERDVCWLGDPPSLIIAALVSHPSCAPVQPRRAPACGLFVSRRACKVCRRVSPAFWPSSSALQRSVDAVVPVQRGGLRPAVAIHNLATW